MEIIYLLIPLSLVLFSLAIWGFFWAVKSGQFDDLDSPALSILDDDSGNSPIIKNCVDQHTDTNPS